MTYTAIYSYYQGDRKDRDFADVYSTIYFDTIPEADRAAFKMLDFVDAQAEGITNPFSDLADVWADAQYFILQVGSELYFIDTQGYNYCRYVAKIVNFKGELSLFFPM
jgi:hypothetical protein